MVIKRVGGKLVEVSDKISSGFSTQSQKLQAQRQQRDTLRRAGARLSIQLDPKKFTGTIKDYESTLRSIDPAIIPFLTVNLASIKQEQSRRLAILKKDIEKARLNAASLRSRARKETSNQKKDRLRARAVGEESRREAGVELASRISKGELIDLNKASAFLSSVESRSRKLKQAGLLSRSSQIKLVAQSRLDLNQFVGKNLTNKELKERGLSFSQVVAIGKAELANRSLNRELAMIKQGRASVGGLLKEGRITANQADRLVREIELSPSELSKIRNSNVNLIFQKLATGKGRTAVDSTTQIRAFKVGVNQALGRELEKSVPFSSSVETFSKALKTLEKKKKLNQTVIRKGVTAAISSLTSSIENKALTGQTLTPKEKAIFLGEVARTKKVPNKVQSSLLKNILLSPVNYGRALVLRSQAGDRFPLITDLTSFSKGVGKGLKDLFVDPLIGSFTYGQSLVLRAAKQGTSANKILVRDIKKLAGGVKNVVLFVKDNPIATGFIVSTAIGTGLKLTKSEFKRNPAESLGRAIAWFFPSKILKGVGKAGKLAVGGVTKLKNSEVVLNLLKRSKSFPRLSSTNKLRARKDLMSRAIVANTRFPQKGKALESVELKLFNTLRNLPEKTLVTRLNKIPKLKRKLFRAPLVKTKLSILQQRKNLLARSIVESTSFKVQGDKLKNAKQILFNRLNKLPEKTLVAKVKKVKIVKIKPVDKQPKEFTLDQLRKSSLENVKGNVPVKPNKSIAIIDLSKINPKSIVVDIRVITPKLSSKQAFKTFKSRALSSVKVTKIDLTKPLSVPKKVVGTKTLIGPKGKANLNRGVQVQIRKNLKQLKQAQAKVRSSKTLVQIKASQRQLAILKLELSKVLSTLSLINSRGLASMARAVAILNKLLKAVGNVSNVSIKKAVALGSRSKVAQKAATLAGQKAGSVAAQKASTLAAQKLKQAQASKLRNVRLKKFLTSKTARKIRFPNLTLDSKVPKGSHLSFNMLFRRKGKVITRRLELPFNKALREAIRFIKLTPARSTELTLVGLTKEIDIKRPSLKDFKFRKKNSRVLLLVEIPKSAIKGLKRR